GLAPTGCPVGSENDGRIEQQRRVRLAPYATHTELIRNCARYTIRRHTRQHDRAVDPLRRIAEVDDIEAGVAQRARRGARHSAATRSVQHLDPTARGWYIGHRGVVACGRSAADPERERRDERGAEHEHDQPGGELETRPFSHVLTPFT